MMKLLSLGVLFTIPSFLFSQDLIAGRVDNHLIDTGATVDSPSDSVPTSAAASISNAAAIEPLTPAQKASGRALRLAEPMTLFGSAAVAGINQWRDVPKEWGQGSEGYAVRFASAEGFAAAHNAVALGFDLVMHTDPRYRRMPEGRVGARLWNAVSQSFVANKDSGGKTINLSEIVGNFGAGFISNTWQPQSHSGTGDALTRGALGFTYHTAKNVAQEFLPDLLHPHQRAFAGGKGSD